MINTDKKQISLVFSWGMTIKLFYYLILSKITKRPIIFILDHEESIQSMVGYKYEYLSQFDWFKNWIKKSIVFAKTVDKLEHILTKKINELEKKRLK
jgi:hypothetical protein